MLYLIKKSVSAVPETNDDDPYGNTDPLDDIDSDAEWTDIVADLPVLLQEPRICMGVCVAWDKLIIAGGYIYDGIDIVASNETWIVTKNSSGEWEFAAGPNLNIARGEFELLFHEQQNKVLAMGGYTFDDEGDGSTIAPTSWQALIADDENGTIVEETTRTMSDWGVQGVNGEQDDQTRLLVPMPRDSFGAVYVPDSVYGTGILFAGGKNQSNVVQHWDSSGYFRDLWRYTNTWEAITEIDNVESDDSGLGYRDKISGVVFKGKAYLGGGANPGLGLLYRDLFYYRTDLRVLSQVSADIADGLFPPDFLDYAMLSDIAAWKENLFALLSFEDGFDETFLILRSSDATTWEIANKFNHVIKSVGLQTVTIDGDHISDVSVGDTITLIPDDDDPISYSAWLGTCVSLTVSDVTLSGSDTVISVTEAVTPGLAAGTLYSHLIRGAIRNDSAWTMQAKEVRMISFSDALFLIGGLNDVSGKIYFRIVE